MVVKRTARTIPRLMPKLASQTAQTHWLLADRPMAKLDTIYPHFAVTVMPAFLNEGVSFRKNKKRIVNDSQKAKKVSGHILVAVKINKG